MGAPLDTDNNTPTTDPEMQTPRYQVHHEVRGDRVFLAICDMAEMRFDSKGRPNMVDLARVSQRTPSAEREVFATDTPESIMAKIKEMEVEAGMPLGVSNGLKEAMGI